MAALGRPRIEFRTAVNLVNDVRSGTVRIPPFQRAYRWQTSDVTALFDSLYRGYPVGNLLFWRRPAPAERLRLGHLEIDAPQTETAHWVVDGQQRIISIVAALTATADTTDPRFRIYFDLESERFISTGSHKAASGPLLPVHIIGDTKELLAWHRENAEWLTTSQVDLADSVSKAVREYQIPGYVVTGGTEEQVRIIFDRMNSTGKRLRAPEVFAAIHAGLDHAEPSTLADLAAVSAQVSFGVINEQLALRCMLAYRGGDIFRDFHDEFDSRADRSETFSGQRRPLSTP